MLRLVAAAGAFVLSVLLVGAAVAAAVLVFAGPHSDLLPAPLQVIVYLLAWAALLGLPAWAARAVWRRLGRPETN